jgi:integrase/recombinase XerD
MLTVKSFRGKISGMDRRTQRLVDGWLAGHPSPNTRAAYRQDLTRFARWCAAAGSRPLAVGPEDLDTYRDACLAEGASTATVARRLSGIASFFRYAAAKGAVRGDPAGAVERPVATDPAQAPVLDPGEMQALLAAAGGLGPKAEALVMLLGLDGMKLGEALAIDVGDVSLGRPPSVSLERRGAAQIVSLSKLTAKALAAYIADRRSGPLFLGDSAIDRRPARLTRFGADFIIKRAGSAAGIDRPISANTLRRSFITDAHREGRSLEVIARHVGHRDVRETARFVDGRG